MRRLGPPAGDLMPPGAVPLEPGGGGDDWRISVWAPRARAVTLRLATDLGPAAGAAGSELALDHLGEGRSGYFGLEVAGLAAGTPYWLVLEGDGSDGAVVLADPASRHQPSGVHGPSALFDTGAHAWRDAAFVSPPLWRYVIYELHVGTFTAAGTFDAALDHLDALVELGVTAVEPMPIAQFPGRWNWGYDGVFPFAVQDSYGGPAAFQRFVDACHARHLAVVLDVVYNHLGPEGAVLDRYGPYTTTAYRTPWGSALNYSQAGSDEVRHYFIENACMWVRDFHVDALRLDAVHSIVDPTPVPFLAELSTAVADLSSSLGRPVNLIAESADNDPRVVSARALGGLGLDAQWNDDFHHALHAALSGERFGYYADFGRLDQLARAIGQGFVYQGQHSRFRGRRHGAPSAGLDPQRFVTFVTNHDQVGNRPAGDRPASLLSEARLRLAAAVVVFSPGIPLIFMGEEHGETAPFPFFVDYGDAGLRQLVIERRASELAGLGAPGQSLDPTDEATRRRAVLRRAAWREPRHRRTRLLYGALLRLRRTEPLLHRAERSGAGAWVVGDVLVIERSAGPARAVLLCNFGEREATVVLPEGPPGVAGRWQVLLDSGDPGLGGGGTRAAPPGPDRSVVLGAEAFVGYRWRPATGPGRKGGAQW